LALESLAQAGAVILNPLVTLWNSFVNMLPGIIAAIIILIIGYFVAYLLGLGLKALLEKLGLNKWIQKSALSKSMGHTNVAAFLGEILKWYVFIVFLQVAAEVLELGTLSDLLMQFVLWLPHVIAAVIIVFVGVALAHYVEIKIKEHSKMKGINIGAYFVKLVIILIAAIIALEQIGVQVKIIENAFLIIVGAIGLGFAIAIGIGLGNALKGPSQKWLESLKKR